MRASAVETAAMKGAAATAVKATATAMAAATRVLCEGRTCGRDGQCRQCTHYEPTQFSACHDSSPSFL
jgi:hypothetical protein